MQIIRPIQITESMLDRTQINIYDAVMPAGLYANYASGTNYGVGAVVIDRDNQYSAGNRVYESVTTPNQGNAPVSDDGTYWNYLYSIPMVWSSGETFGLGEVCYTTTSEGTSATTGNPDNTFTVWESVQNGNLNHNPDSDDGTWWVAASYTPAEWKGDDDYAVGEKVFYRADNSIYECIATDPASTLRPPPDFPTHWERASSSDIYKVRDQVLGTSGTTSRLQNITFVFTPIEGAPINSIAILNVYGVTATVTMDNGAYSQEKNLTVVAGGDSDIVSDWWSYFFSETRTVNNVVFTDLPAVIEPVTVEIVAGPTTTVEVGEIVAGRWEDLGVTQYAPEVSIIDYSRKDVDQYGNYTITERAFSKRVNIRTLIPNYRIGPVTDLLSTIRATPVVWIPTEVSIYDETLLIYGFYKDFRMVIPHAKWAEMDLQIEGLT